MTSIGIIYKNDLPNEFYKIMTWILQMVLGSTNTLRILSDLSTLVEVKFLFLKWSENIIIVRGTAGI